MSDENKPDETKIEEQTLTPEDQEYLDAVEEMNTVLGDRNISDLALNDPYWDAQRKASVLFNKHKRH